MKKAAITIIIICNLSLSTAAQVQSDSLEYISALIPINYLAASFDKQLNTFNLNTALFYSADWEKFSFNLSENYNSTFIRSTDKSIRDEQFLSLSAAYKFSPQLSFGAWADNNILSDSRRIELNQASASNATIFSRYTPSDKINFAPFFGYTNNRQIGEDDYGFVYGTEGLIDELEFSDFHLSSELKFRNEDISPRKNTVRYFNLLVNNGLDMDVINSINAAYSENRKDFYYEADSITSAQFNINNNIQSRIESNYLLQDRLQTENFLNLFSLDFLGRVIWRSVDRNTRYRSLDLVSTSIFDTRINELRIEVETILNYTSSIFDGSLRVVYSERDEKHITKNFQGTDIRFFEERSNLESMKNNNSLRASVSFLGNIRFSSTDRLSFSLFQNKLRYDTPSSENFDDRDEILSIVRLRYSKLLTPFFTAFINAEGTLNHTVYLFAVKSSNNNINRVLRLTAGGNYNGKNFSSLNSFEVTANYTVYDFERLSRNFRSFSFRQFTATDSSRINFSKRLSFNIYSYIKLSEQGDLKWGDFKTKPNRYLQEIYSEPKLSVSYNSLNLSAGIRYFTLNTFNYNQTEKVIDSEYESIGPVAELFLSLNGNLFVKIYGWYEFITINKDQKKEQVNVTMQMNWKF